MRMDGFGFPIDWKKVVASITNPKMGVMQKLILNPEAPIFSISSDAPKASRIALGKNKTASQIMQVMPAGIMTNVIILATAAYTLMAVSPPYLPN